MLVKPRKFLSPAYRGPHLNLWFKQQPKGIKGTDMEAQVLQAPVGSSDIPSGKEMVSHRYQAVI